MSDELDRLGRTIAWPETPDVSAAVLARLASEPEASERATPRPPRFGPRRVRLGPLAPRLAWVICALAVALTGTVAAIPDARSAVLEFLGLKSAKIERREPRPGLGNQLDLGRRVSLEEARRVVDFDVRVPDLPGAEVYADPALPAGGQVNFLAAGPLLVSEYDAHISPVIMKAAGARTQVESLTIDGHPAFWLTGARHEFAYVDRNGAIDADHARLAGDVLLYETGDLLIRVEGARSKQAAIDLVRSLR